MRRSRSAKRIDLDPPAGGNLIADGAQMRKHCLHLHQKEAAMQQGSIIQTSRKQGPNVWLFRWSEKNRNGRRVYRKRVIGTVEQYPDGGSARAAAAALLAQLNVNPSHGRACKTTVEQICEHFEQKELRSGDSFRSCATVKTYCGYIRKWISRGGGRSTSTKLRLWTSKRGCADFQWLDHHARRFEMSCQSCLNMRAGTSCSTAIRCDLSARAQRGGALQLC